MNLPIELKTRIYHHIGIVQQHLAELPADEQREILESIETHVYDALESRSDSKPTLELVEAIISEMDPPESYGPLQLTTGKVINKTAGKSRTKGCAIAIFAFMGLILASFILYRSGSQTAAPIAKPKTEKTVPAAPNIGKWTAIDFVASVSEFNPTQTKWSGELTLKGVEFFEDGTTDKPWWTWKENALFHSAHPSEAAFMIVKINQVDYLFVEWVSGDVVIRKEKPKYYVLKRGAYIDPSQPKTIVEGVGWHTLHIGATRTELIAEFGSPDNQNGMVMSWNEKGISCHLSGGENSALHKAVQLNFSSNFNGATSKGIKTGSSEEEVLAAYGTPTRISTGRVHKVLRAARVYDPKKTMTWPELGIQISLSQSSGVTQIDIIKSQ